MTGEVLGSHGPALPVQVETKMYAGKPTLLNKCFPKLFPQRADKVTIQVCCQGCASKVQEDPDTYIRKVVAVKNGLSK